MILKVDEKISTRRYKDHEVSVTNKMLGNIEHVDSHRPVLLKKIVMQLIAESKTTDRHVVGCAYGFMLLSAVTAAF